MANAAGTLMLCLLCAAPVLHAQVAHEPEVHATGIFVSMAGDVLTARHAVEGCRRLYVVKDGRAAPASLRASSRDVDAAVLRTGLKPLLAATFPASSVGHATPTAVFAEGYSALQSMPDRARALFNAVTVPDARRFSMLSPVRPGASGSAVLNADGQVLAMVVARAEKTPDRHATRVLSRHAARTPMPAGGASEVNAVPAQAIVSFLREHAIAFEQSDAVQLGRGQASAPRAATLSAGVICEK